VRDLYKSRNGLYKETDDFHIQAELVRKRLDELIRWISIEADGVALREHAQNMCRRTTKHLPILESARIGDTNSLSKTLGAAVKCLWKNEQFAESFKAIGKADTNITTHIVTTRVLAM
jgi:hypothetical protein